MNQHSKRITALLLASRTDFDQLSELSQAVRDASDSELRLAVMKYSMDLLAAARTVIELQINLQQSAEQAANGGMH